MPVISLGGFGMAQIRSLSDIAQKWASVTPQRSGDYESGVKAPRGDWARNTAAAAEAWKAGIQNAIQTGAFSKGVNRAGTPAWQDGSVNKGVARWGPGVQLAQEKYGSGFAPYRDAIERTTLPPRYARRDPRNLQRVSAIVEAMNKVKAAARG